MNISDPEPMNVNEIAPPDTWPDLVSWKRPKEFFHLIAHVFGPRQSVELPASRSATWGLPGYLLQEFHHIPNGNYSNNIADGYSRGFDVSMLGLTHSMRRKLAQEIAGRASALDIGCGSGALAKEFVKSGIQDVWAIDASPYLLGRAAKRFPEVKFIHGLAESLPFADGRFEAVGVCFLFHELPSVIARQVLQEIYRVLAPGGIVVITEPSPEQMRIKNWWHLIRLSGLKALYFHLLARLVFEPFVEEWHALEPSKWFAESGFQMLRDEKNLPFRFLVAKK